MISLHSMTIQGIRSFGPDEKDQQTIRFNSPVTLVLGQNGCGKTTIIESLKYCLTGELPPSTSSLKGSSFIHDPKIAHLCEVRGNVKLKLKTANGDSLTVSRSAQVQQEAKTVTYKTLDCSISFGKDDNVKQASKRCINVEQEVCRILSVSKAILNYVIFCHQEDSFWPLDEPKKVKERFDAIFSTTRFNKALDQILKLKKSYQTDINGLVTELNGLEKIKGIVDDKKLKVLNLEEKLEDCKIKLKEYSYSINPIEIKLREVSKREFELSEIHASRESKKTLCLTIRNQLTELESTIKGTFEGSEQELEKEIKEFKGNFDTKKENLEKLKQQLTQYNAKDETLSRRLNQEQKRLGQLQTEEDQQQSRNHQIKALVVSLSNDLNIFLSQDVIINIDGNIKDIKSNYNTMKDNYTKKKKEFENIEKEIEDKIFSLRDSKVKIEQDLTGKSRQMAENKQEIKKIQQNLSEIDQASSDLVRLEQKISKIKQELEENIKRENVDNLKSEIKSLESKFADYESQLEKVYTEVQVLQEQNSIQIEYDNLKESKAVKESSIKKIKNKHFNDLKNLLKIEKLPEQGIKYEFKNCLDNLSSEISKKNEILKQKQKELLILENNKKHLKEKIQEQEKDLKVKEESIYETFGDEDFNQTLNTLNETIEKLQDQKGTLNSSEVMYRSYINQLKASEPCCPLCHRDFSNEADVTDLVYELESKVKEVPTKIKNNKDELDKLQQKYTSMLKIQPTVESIKSLQDNDLPSLRIKLKDFEKNIESLKSEIENLNQELLIPIADEELAKNMHGDIIILDQHLADVKKVSKEMEKLESQLTKGGERSLSQALADQESLRNESTNVRQQLSLLNSRLNNYTDRVNDLKEKHNALVKEQLVLQGNAQRRDQYKTRLADVEKLLSENIKEHAEISAKLTPAKEELEKTINTREEKRNEHKKQLEKDNQKLNDMQTGINEMNRIQKEIEFYNDTHKSESGDISALDEVKNRIEKLESERGSLLEKKNSLSAQIKDQSDHISNQELRLRELNDIKKQRNLEKEISTLENEIQQLRTILIEMNHDSLQKEKKKLMTERDDIEREKARIEGSKKEIETSLQEQKEELEKPDFKFADKYYYDKLIKLKIKEMSCEDLMKFYNALDWSLQQFHKQKMEQINKIIREMWIDIYQGNDIDFIQIKTEDEGVRDFNKRRTFNYGVVQHRNKAVIDMRGRCSAGQKMLACLIIRLALAQTFSTNCGIMTLDEPTTNLDRENIRAMCQTLSKLLNSEHAKKNLQFVIITHDDKFLQELRRLDTLETYYRVARNKDGLSTLSRQRI